MMSYLITHPFRHDATQQNIVNGARAVSVQLRSSDRSLSTSSVAMEEVVEVACSLGVRGVGHS